MICYTSTIYSRGMICKIFVSLNHSYNNFVIIFDCILHRIYKCNTSKHKRSDFRVDRRLGRWTRQTTKNKNPRLCQLILYVNRTFRLYRIIYDGIDRGNVMHIILFQRNMSGRPYKR